MANFTIVPCIPDGKHSIEIQYKRAMFKETKLTELSSEDDTTRLQITTNFWYKKHQRFSAANEIIKNGSIFILNEHQLLKLGVH